EDKEGELRELAGGGVGVSGEAQQGADHAGAVVDRPAEAAGGRRAGRDGRRQRLQPDPAEGAGRAGGGRLSGGRDAADQRTFGGIQGGAPPQRGAAVLQLAAWAGSAAKPPPLRRP